VVTFLVTRSAICDELRRTPLEGFKDTYYPNVQAGGASLVGATSADDTAENLLQPAIFVPADLVAKNLTICIEATSIDGTYRAHGALGAPILKSTGGRLRFEFADTIAGPSKHRSVLEAIGAAQLALLARFGSCGSITDTTRVLVVDRSRQDQGQPLNGIRLYVNSGMATRARVEYKNVHGSVNYAACEGTSTSFRAKAFNLVCLLSGPFAERTKVKLMPARFRIALPVESYELIYANPSGAPERP
jgi:hypothetical protein